MPKPLAQQQEFYEPDAGSLSSRRSSITGELDDTTRRSTHEAVRVFVDQHNLTPWFTIFRKASVVLQGDLSLDEIDDLTQVELQALQNEVQRKWRQPKALYFTILVCSIAAIEQGWAQTGMNGANLTFPKAFGIDSDSSQNNLIVGLINSGNYFGAGVL